MKLAYVEQSRDSLNPDHAVWQAMADGQDGFKLGPNWVTARAYAARFGFTGQDQQKKLGVLSGGERNRIHLARMLKSGTNVLLLDEPTNDLDVNTIRALEEALENFAGCAVIITHDRWFLDRIGHPHPRVRGRQPGGLVRGELPGVRRGPEETPRDRETARTGSSTGS